MSLLCLAACAALAVPLWMVAVIGTVHVIESWHEDAPAHCRRLHPAGRR